MTHEGQLRVLLCWGYHRAGWIRPFEQLRDRLDVHFLFYRTAEEEQQEGTMTNAPRHYWMDFRDAAAIIDRIAPDRIVFMALDGAWVIALNSEAQRRQIPTFIVQHGHFNPSEESSADVPKQGLDALKGGSPLPALLFAARSFGLTSPAAFARTLRFMVEARRGSASSASLRYRFEQRMPNYYITLSPESAQIHVEEDQASFENIACIGIPEYDDIFSTVPLDVPAAGTMLLVDSPNAENRWGAVTTSIEGKIRFLRSIDSLASSVGLRLRVKLHPESYQAHWLPALTNGVYLRDADMPREFTSASLCVGFDSTLMIPAVWLRPTILIRLRPWRIVNLAAETDAATVLDHLDELDSDTIQNAFGLHEARLEARRRYVARIAFRPDGNSLQRLEVLLREPDCAFPQNSLAAANASGYGL
jgi:hypothetical protein